MQAAIVEMVKALRFNPESSEIYVNLGIVYGRSGNHIEAEEHFRKAAALDPDNGFALQNLGIVLVKQNRYPEAVQVLEQALKKPIGNAAAIHNSLAVLYLRQKDAVPALSHAQDSIEINPDYLQGTTLVQVLPMNYADRMN